MALSLSDIEKRKKARPTVTPPSPPESKSSKAADSPRLPWDAPTSAPGTPKKRKAAKPDVYQALSLGATQDLAGYMKALVKLNRERLAQGKSLRFLLPFGYKQKKPGV